MGGFAGAWCEITLKPETDPVLRNEKPEEARARVRADRPELLRPVRASAKRLPSPGEEEGPPPYDGPRRH